MTRCPNCYNSITPDTQTCPSCAYLLIQSEKTPMSHLSAAAPAQARSSGRLQTVEQVRTSGRLAPTEQAEPSSEDGPQPVYNGTNTNGAPRQPRGSRRKSRKAGRAASENGASRKLIFIPLVVIGLGAVAVLLAPATHLITWQVDAETSLSTLTAFRSQPSKQSGKTVDECVNEWLDESRKSERLVSYSGWSIRTIRFDKSKILLSFSFEENSGVITAEWLADVRDNTFTAKDDLAAQVY